MPPTNPNNPTGVQSALDALDAEIAAAAALQRDSVFVQYETGMVSTDIDHSWTFGSLDAVRFRLVYIRIHFLGGAGTNALTISMDSSQGTAHDTVLATIAAAGEGSDVNYVVKQEEARNPSPWSFGIGDSVHVDWASASAFTSWAAEIGLSPAL